MKNKFIFFSFLFVTQSLFAFTVSVPIDTPKILFPLGFVAGSTSGHEEITRQAMNRIDISLKAAGLDIAASYPEFLGDRDVDIAGANGLTSKNLVIKGNYATDMPNGLLSLYNIPKWHGQPEVDWTNNPNIQVLHFLRNVKPDNSLVSPYETCMSAREEIIKSTVEGVRLWNAGDHERGLFLIGHASHTIQDSFSSAHTVRDDSAHNNDLKNVCYYGKKRPDSADLCYHEPIDARDDIWLSNALDIIRQIFITISPVNSWKESNLKSEAVLARTATMRYLFLVAIALSKEGPNDLTPEQVRSVLTQNLFEGSSGVLSVDQGLAIPVDNVPISMPNGIMRCQGLSKN